MLSILLLLVSPQTTVPSIPPAPPSAPQGTLRVFGQPEPGCASVAIPASDPTARNDLLWREGQDRVGHYLLLDRYVNGCPEPIVVNDRVTGSNAVGREVYRMPAPLPSYTPPPVRVP